MPKNSYTRSERLERKTATGVLDDPKSTPADRLGALKVLAATEKAAGKRQAQKKEDQPAPFGATPTPSRPWLKGPLVPCDNIMRVVRQKLEAGDEEGAELAYEACKAEYEANPNLLSTRGTFRPR